MLFKKEFPSVLYSICNFDFVVTIVIVQMCLSFKKSLQERSLDISRALKSVTLGQSSLDCKANVEQYSTTKMLFKKEFPSKSLNLQVLLAIPI
jgi:hypothetical protein